MSAGLKIVSARQFTVVLVASFVLTGCLEKQSEGQEELAGDTPDETGNRPPTISIGAPPEAVATVAFELRPSASDPDGDTLTFRVENKPTWANFDIGTGVLTGTPQTDDIGSHSDVIIFVDDGQLSRATDPFTLTVRGQNQNRADNAAPTISGTPPTAIAVGSLYVFAPNADDADGDTLQFQIANRPQWASFDASTGRLSGIPQEADIGTFDSIRIGTTDGSASAYLPPFDISVSPVSSPNNAPTISGMPAMSIVAGDLYVFSPTASDTDNDTLTFAVSNLPSWASFNASNGTLSGRPQERDIGKHERITISVSDGQQSTGLSPFTITVVERPISNSPPSIGGSPTTSVVAGDLYTFVPIASDPDDDPLTFGVSNLPTWATFDPSSGTLSGIPSRDQVGTYPNIRISVSDGEASAMLDAFSVVVSAPNQPPTISGTALSEVMVGQTYTFEPIARDPDNGPGELLWSIENLPDWAVFDTGTGLLSGTPGAQDIGVYVNITIGVNDGDAHVFLAPFQIDVVPTATGSAMLSWLPPTTRTDDSPLTNLQGFRIYYGKTPGSYTEQIELPYPDITSYLVEDLTSGQWYFAMTSYDSDDVESAFSDEKSKTID